MYDHGTHRTQYDGSALANENCVPTSGANGARETSQGSYDKSGAQIRSLVAKSEETNPNTPGWTLEDLSLAMIRAGIPFHIKKGSFSVIQETVTNGYAVAIPGDSDQFSDGTCSGRFNGDHMICVHPDSGTTTLRMLLADPICIARRWERTNTIQNYAEKFAGSDIIKFGVFGQEGMSAVLNFERWAIPKDTPFYEVPNGQPIGKYNSATTITTIGPALTKLDPDGTDYKWRLALAFTGVVNDTTGWKAVWIKRPAGNPIATDPAWDRSLLALLLDPTGRYPVNIPAPDCTDKVNEAISDYHSRVIASIPTR